MRAAGALLTILALVLVQAPWIVCGCEDDSSCGPLFADCHCLGAHEPDADSHGHQHAHGEDCDHEHADAPDAPEAPCDHVGFRLPFGTMPAPVATDIVLHAAIDVALVLEHPTAVVSEARIPTRSDPPPQRLLAPSVLTECLLF